jgi:hypothetical protein
LSCEKFLEEPYKELAKTFRENFLGSENFENLLIFASFSLFAKMKKNVFVSTLLREYCIGEVDFFIFLDFHCLTNELMNDWHKSCKTKVENPFFFFLK